VPGNDAEELLPVAAFEKVIKTTITQATSPVTREDMGTAYKAAIPGATVTVSPEAPCRGRAGAPGLSPRRHASPCAWQCWRSSPDKVERTRRGTSCQVAGGFEERASRGHPAPAPPQNHGSRAGSSTHILPAEYAPVTHRNAGVAGGAQINQSGPSPSGSDMSRYPRR